jgi:hypothetical protein
MSNPLLSAKDKEHSRPAVAVKEESRKYLAAYYFLEHAWARRFEVIGKAAQAN